MTSEHHHDHAAAPAQSVDYFEPAGWEERYAGDGRIWSGRPNAQLVAEVSSLTVGSALDVGCGEGGDVVWLAQQGWTVTGADFSAQGLARAARHAADAGVGGRTDWWQVDAREIGSEDRTWDLVTTHFLHPPGGLTLDVTRRLADLVSPGGHLLVVGHAPSEAFAQHSPEQHRAMFLAADLLPALPEDFDAVVVEQRPRTTVRDGVTHEIDDSTLLARRRP